MWSDGDVSQEIPGKLTTEEQQELKALVSRGRAAAYRQTHARVLLLSDEGQGGGAIKDEEIVRVLQIGRAPDCRTASQICARPVPACLLLQSAR